MVWGTAYLQLVTVEFNFCLLKANVYASKIISWLQSARGCVRTRPQIFH